MEACSSWTKWVSSHEDTIIEAKGGVFVLLYILICRMVKMAAVNDIKHTHLEFILAKKEGSPLEDGEEGRMHPKST